MEILCKIIGMCLTFIPSIYLATYLIKKATCVQKFDAHIRKVKDNAGNYGMIMALLNRLVLFILLTSLGIYITSYFENDTAFSIVVVSLFVYIITCYFDNKNDIQCEMCYN